MIIGICVADKDWEDDTIYLLDSNLLEHRYFTIELEASNVQYDSIKQWKASGNYFHFFDTSYSGKLPRDRGEAVRLVKELFPELAL